MCRASLVALLVCSAGCRLNPGQSRQGQVALEFARALSVGRFDEAHKHLSSELGQQLPVPKLREAYEGMVSYGQPGKADVVQVMEAMDYWPAKKAGDVGWAYVAIAGDSFSEGLAIVVADEGGRLVIRDIEWGRP